MGHGANRGTELLPDPVSLGKNMNTVRFPAFGLHFPLRRIETHIKQACFLWFSEERIGIHQHRPLITVQGGSYSVRPEVMGGTDALKGHTVRAQQT